MVEHMNERNCNIHTWNYRILRRECPVAETYYFTLTEVYYSEDGDPVSHIDRAEILSEDIDDCKSMYLTMEEAFCKPVLSYDGKTYLELDI